MTYLLAADIGGTNSRFALFTLHETLTTVPDLRLIREQWFPTANYRTFADLARDLHMSDGSPFVPPGTRLASLGIAGPVRDGACTPPNIAWSVRTDEAAAALGIPVVLLVNDFVAQGYACLFAALSTQAHAALELMELWAGANTTAPRALVGAGSGCGKALILPDARMVLPSEGGHGDFPFRRDEEAFANALRDVLGERISMETLASGDGLCRLFAHHCGEDLQPAAVCSRLNPPHTAAQHSTLAWFARFYGRVCRNFVLDTMALGGLYVTGGMAKRVPVLEHPAFLESFWDSDHMGGMLRDVPVFHIRSQHSGLWGAAAYGVIRATLQERPQ